MWLDTIGRFPLMQKSLEKKRKLCKIPTSVHLPFHGRRYHMIRFLRDIAIALLAGPMAFLSFFVGLLLLAIGSLLGLAALSFFVFALWWLFLWVVMHDADAPKYFFEALLGGFIPSAL